MSYSISIKRTAQKDIASLHPSVRQAVDQCILSLADEPRPVGATPLKGEWRGYWRVRVGECRVIYTVDRKAQVVVIAAVGPRERIYG